MTIAEVDRYAYWKCRYQRFPEVWEGDGHVGLALPSMEVGRDLGSDGMASDRLVLRDVAGIE